MKNKLFVSLALVSSLVFGPAFFKMARRDFYIPTKVVQLFGPEMRGSCSGVHVDFEGKTYLVSAAHCLVLAQNGKILVKDDAMDQPILLSVIKEDNLSDLLILEPLPGRTGLSLAEYVTQTEQLYTYTHGLGFATYKTQGSFIQETEINVPLFLIDETNFCDVSKPKLREMEFNAGFFILKVCMLVEKVYATDAFIAPGSSGGVVTNKYGEIVGIVSAGGEGFGFLVTLTDLRNFLSTFK